MTDDKIALRALLEKGSDTTSLRDLTTKSSQAQLRRFCRSDLSPQGVS